MRAVSIAFFSCVLVGSAGAQDFSPIPVRNYWPYSTLFLRFEPGRQPLPFGAGELTLNGVASNTLNFVPNQIVGAFAEADIENDRLDIRYARGIGKGWELSIQSSVEDFGPGFLDPIISWYHRTFLRLHSIRDFVPYGGHLVFSPSGGPFTGGFGIGDTSLFAAKSLGGTTFLTAGLKLPTGNPNELLGSGSPDVGLAGQTTWRFARQFGVTFNGGLIAQGDAERIAHTRALVLQGGFTLVYASNKRDGWIIEADYEESPNVEGVEALDKVEPSTTFGYRRQISARQSLTAYFMEDINALNTNFPIGADIGPDFVIGLTWTYRL